MNARRRVCAVILLLLAWPGSVWALQRFHDPSSIVRCKDEYWLFTTGPGVRSWHSRDLAHWEEGPHALTTLPAWINDIVPGHQGYFWAPDCIVPGGRYLLYYSVSAWGRNESAIGLASNPTLDPADPAYGWKDEGIVMRSHTRDGFNAIDPSLLLDPGGRLWMAFGSFWGGIKLAELDPASGQRLRTDAAPIPLAYHHEIEAPCLVSHGDAFYLFLDWGFCCRGLQSTYEIRVGRSDRVTGPFLDKSGVDLRKGGGSLFLGNEGSRIGPGHPAVFRQGDDEWLSYHFYDGTHNGVGTLAIRRLEWDADGWPTPGAMATGQ